MNDLLVLLLPLAAFTGWWLARSDKPKDDRASRDEDYFKGLSYLLEDETDKALDVFIRIAHLDDSAIENQITLGNLFRHRGEIDRALHIHTTLGERSEIVGETKDKLNLALADDYFKAGIMNHAETYYQQVISEGNVDIRNTARRHLVRLFAEQSFWGKAIEVAEDLDPFKRQEIQKYVAHYHCELAKINADNNKPKLAKIQLEKALLCDKNCVRAQMKLGRMAKDLEQYVAAIGHFQAIEKQDRAFLLEILNDLEFCYGELKQPLEWLDYLTQIEEKETNSIISLRLSQVVLAQQGRVAAIGYLNAKLHKKPSMIILQAYLNLIVDEENQNTQLDLVASTVQKLLGFTLKYRCKECGFRGNQLNWQCPGCKNWGAFVPISDLSLKEDV